MGNKENKNNNVTFKGAEGLQEFKKIRDSVNQNNINNIIDQTIKICQVVKVKKWY